MGLISRHIDSIPTIYEAVNAKEAISILLKLKKKEYYKADEVANSAIKDLSKYEHKLEKFDSDPFVIFRTASNPSKEMMEAMSKVKHTVDYTTRYNLFLHAFNNIQLSDWIAKKVKAEKRGVKFRMILDKPPEEKPISELSFAVPESLEFLRSKGLEIKHSISPLRCIMLIFDNKKCFIETSTDFDTHIDPIIWTNNPILVNLCTEYFERQWEKALTPSLGSK